MPLPPPLAAAVAVIFDQPIGKIGTIAIYEHAGIMRWHGRAIATTRPGRIYLRGSAADFFGNPGLLLHEYCHVLKQWETGRLTRTRYVVQCLQHGYRLNPFEVEARAFAATHQARFQGLVSGQAEAPGAA